ncbi:hypothetical protein Asulf_00214 [Archaeoglobus sulfaticallidus PM70-1]|uniref:DUF1641 domain-containing protein n=1 Tax=Archaeoglobus sulfaticallidus PM70-1 TaxID=387631 RepID=N0BB70_9EURY|nr:DUF1641 domain-containing protein [Archaeoglobus sulfaticallidus]AGK60248.1 hypothetical protein Asulf_00214 [Archaeoglobus sulfaticallidus PM70-1]
MELTEEEIKKLKELANNADALISLSSGLGEILKNLAENKDDINGVIDKLVWLEKSGNLESILGFAALIKIFQDTLSDEVVAKNAEMISNIGLIASKFSSDNSLKLFNAIGDAICRCSGEAEPVGLFGLLKALREPEVQKALGMLVKIAREMGKNI